MYKDRLTYSHQDQANEEKALDKTLQREINLARNIQATLLNAEAPIFAGGEVTGSSLPARLIGGDYYDFYPLVNGKIRIVIGDVMGKGIPAAMLMILTRGAFRSSAESTQSPGATLYAMNKALYQDLRVLRSFVTLFCADWDPETGMLTYANAGHNLPLYIKDKHVYTLPKASGVMVGGLPDQIYKEESISLENNATVFFYTDGIVEAQNKNGDQYGQDRLITTLKDYQNKEVGELEKLMMASIHEFVGDVPQRDDITMVILKVSPEKSDITSYNSPVINT